MNRLLAGIIILLIPVTLVRAEGSLNDELIKCASVQRDLQRLACYDRLSGNASSLPIEALSVKSQDALSKKDKGAKPNSSPGNNPGLPQKSKKTSTPATGSFGLKSKDSGPKSISSTIPGEFNGWNNGDKITLANGQVWKITDPSGRIYHKSNSPQVTITKGVFGTFRMSIVGLNKSVRVVRIK